jgi:hypothetical protein
MTSYKFKARVVSRRAPKFARMEKPTMTRIYIGTIDTTDTGGAIVLPALTPDMDADAIKAAIEEAERVKHEAKARETLALQEMFLSGAEKTGLS